MFLGVTLDLIIGQKNNKQNVIKRSLHIHNWTKINKNNVFKSKLQILGTVRAQTYDRDTHFGSTGDIHTRIWPCPNDRSLYQMKAL